MADALAQYVTLLCPFANDTADQSTYGHVLTANGSAAVAAGDSKWPAYSGSLLLDGVEDWLLTPVSAAFSPGAGDYCLEMWLKPAAPLGEAVHYLWTSYLGDAGGAAFALLASHPAAANRPSWMTDLGTSLSGGSVQWSAAAWNHVAVSRQGTTLRLFLNGDVAAQFTDSRTYASPQAYRVGGVPWGSDVAGRVNDLRLTIGAARYTGAFTPPDAPFWVPVPSAGIVLAYPDLAGPDVVVGLGDVETLPSQRGLRVYQSVGETDSGSPVVYDWGYQRRAFTLNLYPLSAAKVAALEAFFTTTAAGQGNTWQLRDSLGRTYTVRFSQEVLDIVQVHTNAWRVPITVREVG